MTFLEEIEPYLERIKLHRNGKGDIKSIELLREIRDIHFTHIHSKAFKVPSNLCRQCIARMFNQIIGKVERDSCIGKKMTFPKQEPIKVEKEYTTLNVKSMKWGELRKYATSKGIATKGKNKEQLIKELEEL